MRNNLKKNGIMFSETGDLLITEPLLTELMVKARMRVFDTDTVDTARVCYYASSLGLTNLGGFGELADIGEDEFIFHMAGYEIERYESEVRENKHNRIEVLELMINLAESYLHI